MTDSSLKLALNMHSKRIQNPAPQQNEEEEYQAFHYGRVSMKAQFTIGFTRKDGFCDGYPYADFRGWSTSDPRNGFELIFISTKIVIEGRNLDRILELIRQHRLTDLIEARHEQAMTMLVDDPVVTKIQKK